MEHQYRLFLNEENTDNQMYICYIPFVPQIGHTFSININRYDKNYKKGFYDVKVKNVNIDLPNEYIQYEESNPLNIVCDVEIIKEN